MYATVQVMESVPSRLQTVGEWLLSIGEVSLPLSRRRGLLPPLVPVRAGGGSKGERGEPALSLIQAYSPLPSGTGRTDGLGIDLIKRGHEVRKLFYAGFARGLVKDGYDPEDALQEVYRGLLARNAGSCPFDASKSSFGHYVHIVCRCVLANYVRKERRRRSHESSESTLGGEDGTRFSMYEVVDSRVGEKIEPGSLETLVGAVSEGLPRGTEALVGKALSLLAAGYSRREVIASLGVEAKWLEGVLSRVKATLLA